jgi:hypothetical protein
MQAWKDPVGISANGDNTGSSFRGPPGNRSGAALVVNPIWLLRQQQIGADRNKCNRADEHEDRELHGAYDTQAAAVCLLDKQDVDGWGRHGAMLPIQPRSEPGGSSS